MVKRMACLAALLFILLITVAPPAKADGGPVVDPLLFANLKEGQQVAVVRIIDRSTAQVDLFVSILDQTGASHDIVYFVPLGIKATSVSVSEQDAFAFNSTLTQDLDGALSQNVGDNQGFIEALFAGALLTNGVWLTPLWLPVMLSSCGQPPPPAATFKTDSSEVNIFGLDESTDLQALISTTGLDPSVTRTLSRLRGQQIAVVHLRSQPAGAGPGAGSSPGQPGLHLSWHTTLADTKGGATYVYPLGTGAAWAHPIEMTRVYVVAPENVGFSVQYPKLGADFSGFTGTNMGSYKPRIADAGTVPAYSVDTAADQLVQGQNVSIWRAVYTNSNASEDILITATPRSGTSFGATLRRGGPFLAFFVGAFVGALFWVLAWILLMPHLVGKGHKVNGLWQFPFIYFGWNALVFLPAGILVLVAYALGAHVFAAVLAFVFYGMAGFLTFVNQVPKLEIYSWKAIRAFFVVALASGAGYLVFALVYARLVGAI